MAYKVRITDSAKAELDEIVAYFVNTLCNPKAAVNLIEDEENKKGCHNNAYIQCKTCLFNLWLRSFSQHSFTRLLDC